MITTTKRPRRTKAEMDSIRAGLYEICREHQPLTVRQAFYRAVVAGLIPKTHAQYSGTVCRLLTEMRLSGDLPFEWLVDNTRVMRKPETYGSLADMLEITRDTYRRALWASQDVHVEVWCESDSAAGVLHDVTHKWDVPLMSARGFSSITFLRESAETINELTKPAIVYYFGDFDPSGVHIDANIQRRLEEWCNPFVDGRPAFTFERVAVTPEQVDRWNLPGSPIKRTDKRSRSFDRDEAVELEAIPPHTLRELCEGLITQHIDQQRLAATLATEEAERETLATVAKNLIGLDQ